MMWLFEGTGYVFGYEVSISFVLHALDTTKFSD